MKARIGVLFLLMGFLFFVSHNASAQQNSTTAYLTEGKLTFKINKPAFHILLSSDGKIMSYAINAEGDVDFDLDGRLKKMGTISISYDFDGRINKIGSEQISYDFDNRVNQIGTTKISYSFITGKIARINS